MVLKQLLVFLAGIAAGFVNVIAGGGSILSMSALIFLGLPPTIANGTNRIAVFSQNVVSVATFRKKGHFEPWLAIKIGMSAVAGSIIGSQIAARLPEKDFTGILPLIMLFVAVLIFIKPHTRIKRGHEGAEGAEGAAPAELSQRKTAGLILCFFFIGVYGGFIQIGTGIIIIAAFSLLTGMSLVRINSLKVFIIAMYLIPSIWVFASHGKVDWITAIILAAGNSLGGWAGTHFAVRKGDKWIRTVLLIVVAAIIIKLLIDIGIFR